MSYECFFSTSQAADCWMALARYLPVALPGSLLVLPGLMTL